MAKEKESNVVGSLLSVSECAERKGVKRQTIHAAIQRGALPAQLVGKYYVIRPEDCEAYQPIIERKDRARRKPQPGEQDTPGQGGPKE